MRSEALKARLAELEERMKERGDVIKRLEAADVEVKKAELSSGDELGLLSAAVRLETAENELDSMAKRIITFEKANMGKRYALQSKRAMADAKEYCGLLSDFFREERRTPFSGRRTIDNHEIPRLIERRAGCPRGPLRGRLRGAHRDFEAVHLFAQIPCSTQRRRRLVETFGEAS